MWAWRISLRTSCTILRCVWPALLVTRNAGYSMTGGVGLKGYRRYFLNKLGWFAITFVAAFLLNFTLPRLMPGDPVAGIVARMAQGATNATGVQAIYRQYTELFGTNKPIIEQF